MLITYLSNSSTVHLKEEEDDLIMKKFCRRPYKCRNTLIMSQYVPGGSEGLICVLNLDVQCFTLVINQQTSPGG